MFCCVAVVVLCASCVCVCMQVFGCHGIKLGDSERARVPCEGESKGQPKLFGTVLPLGYFILQKKEKKKECPWLTCGPDTVTLDSYLSLLSETRDSNSCPSVWYRN